MILGEKVTASPSTPTIANGTLESTLRQLDTPKKARRSAKRWYAEGCGIGGHIAVMSTVAITVKLRKECRKTTDRRICALRFSEVMTV